MFDHEMSGVVFNAFDPKSDIDRTSRNLPHWFQVGAAIFVTCRTCDSLPKQVLIRIATELSEWCTRNGFPCDLVESMKNGADISIDVPQHKLNNSQKREFLRHRDQLYHRSLDDCQGECLFREPGNAETVADAILKFNGIRYDLDSFVVMPNHFHALVQFRQGFDLSTIGQSWLRFSARMINAKTGRSGSLWQAEAFDHIVRSSEQFSYLHRYIADNPKKANLPVGAYRYWTRST